MKRFVSLAITVGALALAAWLLPLHELTASVSPVLAVPLGVFLLCALVPRTPISLGFGVLFGATNGAMWALATAVIASVITFYAGKWAGPDLLAQRAGQRIRKMDAWLAERGLLAVIVVRLIPVAPFGLVGYAYGTSSVQKRHYFAGTAIGLTPGAISYAVIGAAAVNPETLSWLTFVPAAFSALISSTAAIVWRRQHVRQRTTATAALASQLRGSEA